MKRYAWIAGAFLIVVLLVVVEMTIITNASGYEKKEKVVFAKVNIAKNTVITGDMLELREVGTGSIHPGALRAFEKAVTKMVVMNIEAGEMLLDTKLASGERGIIEAVNKSKRLFSVEFDVDQANGWQLADGQFVDIIYVPNNSVQIEQPIVYQVTEGSQESHVSQNVQAVQEVQVDQGAQVGQELQSVDGTKEAEEINGIAEAEEGKEANEAIWPKGVEAKTTVSDNAKVLKNIRIAGLIDEDGKLVDISKSEGIPRYISFEVTEEQAIFLAYAKRSGKLELSSIPGK